jgi:hypothetical protein
VISRFYVQKKDRRFRRVMRRRMRRGLPGPTNRAALRSRRVPDDVKREIAIRDQDLCQVGICPDDVFLDDGHVHVPFSEGGSQTAGNLGRQCHRHNDLQFRGDIRVVRHGTRPIYVDRQGYVLERERRPDEPRRRLEEFLASLDPA